MVLVRCHNKSYNVSPAPMADVDAVMEMVARLALSREDLASFDLSAARLMSDSGKGGCKELERGVPWRFLNVPSGASLSLITGLERVLGAGAEKAVGDRTPQRRPALNSSAVAPSAAVVARAPAIEPASVAPPSSPVVVELTAENMFLFDPRSLEASGVWDDAIDYEVTQRDAMIMQSSLTKNTQTLNSGRLMTQKMRDEERRRKVASLSKARIRIEFEGAAFHHLVVQFHMPAAATLEELHEIVRLKVLKSDHIKYKLMDRTPPRKQVPRTSTSTLHEAGMWPATRLVVVLFDLPDGMDVSDVISESLVRRKGVLPPHKGNAALSPSEEPATVAPTPDAKMSASKAGRSGPAVPKWFKK